MRPSPNVLAWAVCTLTSLAAGDEPTSSFEGEWRTTFATVTLKQNGESVTGSYGPESRFTLKGTVNGNIFTFEYEEGQAKGDAQFVLEGSGNAFSGKFQIRNGRRGIWSGWRPDPAALGDKLGAFTGLWLTDLGLLELSQDGLKVQGRYAVRGDSTLEGKANGRRLDFRFKSFRGGKGWFDLATDGKSLAGAANYDGFPGWFGWQGRSTPQFSRHTALIPGKIVDGSAKNLLTYSVRAPEGYQSGAARKWPAVLVLHGSNMNGRDYVGTIAAAWPDIARDFILLGINGETASNLSDNPQFNYSYVNYVGRSTFTGYPGTDRESPALVSEAMSELKSVYPISHYLLGGHSQGGFLTYSLLMNFPEAIAGAFPVSCGVIFQCEPGAYADESLRRAQRSVPLAIVHAKNDPVVGFMMGQYAANLFGESDWQAFRFFADDNAQHMFARLPVGPAIRWLEANASSDSKTLLDFAAKRLEQKGYRDAISALNRAGTLNLDEGQKRYTVELGRVIEAEAKAGADKYLPLIRQAKDGAWIDGFLAFRDDFEFAPAAHDVIAAFAELRARHDEPAKKAFAEARGLFQQQGKENEGYAKYSEIVRSYYASPLYRTVKRWLEERN
jgi:predicted esterase